ncbi:NAD(P)-binding protein [Gonapodya prolifera JEL478]|uniref:NAD(P)-binding protein n=1 Tax=Gonapodya prolifera (strain JEL478) TaxID=1344416 RepID=A0A139AE75_GONPJ|nr:NAD(P)-binding protein [Gonapodya prolifera JEL478]|eukprot:KXS15126.1 NAD(P)-binding protein [Gonapodya prolifera JEL478]
MSAVVPATQKAWVVQKLNSSPDAHPVITAPTPKVTPNSVLVEVRAVGLNFYDLLYIAGTYQYKPKLPFAIGSEYAGVIVQVGSEVAKTGEWKVGDRVFGTANPGTPLGGAAVEYILAQPSKEDPYGFMKCPPSLNFRECAAMRVTYMTSYHGLVDRGKIQKGEWVLVHAAAGGVGMAAVHIAKAKGCYVIATAGTDEKCQVCLDNGADVAINYNTDKDWGVTIKKLAQENGREGVDVVYDVVGLVEASFKCTAYDARILLVGFTGRTPQNPERIRTNLVLVKGLNVISVTMGATMQRWPEKVAPVWKGIFDLFATTSYKPLVYKTRYRGLETMGQALKDLGGRKTYGM